MLVGLFLCRLALAGPAASSRAELMGLGLLGYLVYGYGIYALERVYNAWYLNYLAIFGAASWLLVLGAVSVVRRLADEVRLPRQLQILSAVGALLQPLIFYPLWISMLIPLMATREQIDSLYSIFILDLAFIMPAFLLVAVGLFRGRSWAVVLAPVMFVLGAVLIFSLALGELVEPAFGSPITLAGLLPPALLTVLFTVLAVLNLSTLFVTTVQHSHPESHSVPPMPARTATRSRRDRLSCGPSGARTGQQRPLPDQTCRDHRQPTVSIGSDQRH